MIKKIKLNALILLFIKINYLLQIQYVAPLMNVPKAPKYLIPYLHNHERLLPLRSVHMFPFVLGLHSTNPRKH